MKLSIFISHSSEFLTDHAAHGDGLIAFQLISRLAARGHTIHVAAAASSIRSQLPANIAVYPVTLRLPFAALRPFEYMKSVLRLFKAISQRTHIDVIHQLNPVFPALSYSLLRVNQPLVLGWFFPDWPLRYRETGVQGSAIGKIAAAVTQPIVRLCDRRQQRAADALILSTPAATSRIYQSELVKSKLHIIPCGVDTEWLVPPIRGQSEQRPSILYIGSLTRRKGILSLLDAFEVVHQQMAECTLVIAGSGDLESVVRRRIASFPSPHRICLMGYVDRHKIPALLETCSVFCLPSDGEPFGMVVLEAMACGKPVVTTSAGGVRHLVDERGGRVVPPQNALALADALLQIVSSRDLQLEMGMYNRQRVMSGFTWEHVIDQIERVYRDVLTPAALRQRDGVGTTQPPPAKRKLPAPVDADDLVGGSPNG